MVNFLVRVKQMSIEFHLVESLPSYDWQCEIDGELVSYRVQIDKNVDAKKLAKERANASIINHALDFAGDSVIKWKTRGFVAREATKKDLEIRSRMKNLL